jgi:hypothetical protein
MTERTEMNSQSVELLQALEAAQKLQIDINDTAALLTGIEGSRMSMEQFLYETRNQEIVLRQRVDRLERRHAILQAQVARALAAGMQSR